MTTMEWILIVLNPIVWGLVAYVCGYAMAAGRFPWQKKP